LLGPWLHGRFNKAQKNGELLYPPNAVFAVEKHMLRWFDWHLKGMDTGLDEDPAVQYYVMGAVGEDGPGNVWRTAEDWPVPAAPTAWYLQPEAGLSTTAPTATDARTTFKADPLRPAEIPGRAFPGAADARAFEKQAEVRTFTSDVLTSPVCWTGKVQAEVFITSTAKDTDLIIRVSDVYPDGRSILIMDMIRRARYRDGFDKEVFLEPGKPARIAMDVGWTSQVFNAGHRIRVTIASTGAPFYEPNPNTGEPLTIEFPENAVVAENAVLHNAKWASRIIVPTVP
jgi:putative CocE/NonD family hydrolase